MKTHQTKLNVSIITAIFVGLFVLMKFLPDSECGFLHYEEVVNENGEVEFCATNSAGFIDLIKLDYPVDLFIEWDRNTNDGTVELKMDGGHFLFPHELAFTHTKMMHLLLIDQSLSDYHHVHPEPLGIDKTFSFKFKPNKPGTYKVFAEVVPKRTRRQLIASGKLETSGKSHAQNFSSKTIDHRGDLKFELDGLPKKLSVNQDYRFILRVRDSSGSYANLEKIMGAKAHMVAFDAERRGFAHMHPIEDPFLDLENNKDLSFLFNVPRKGWYRIFAQVKRNGQPIYAQFDLLVGA